MPYQKEQIENIQLRIQEMFKISSELENMFPCRKFTLDGHLIGSIGEVIAAYYYNLELLPTSTERHDAIAPDNRMVQIKVTQGMHGIALRSEPEHLLVLWLDDHTGNALEVYNGPGNLVWNDCGQWASNGTRPITISKLKKVAAKVASNQRLEPIYPVKRL